MNAVPRVVREHPMASVLGLCLVVIAFFGVRNLLAPEQDARLTAIRLAGYPVTLADLNAFYPAVPADQNAALLYQHVFRLAVFTNSLFDDLTQDLKLSRGEPIPAELRTSLLAAHATNAIVWELLYSATNLPHSRFPLDMRAGHMVLLPHLATVKRATTLLSVEGLAYASAAQPNETYAAFNAACHVGDALREEPILISFLVRIACSAIVVKRLEQALNLVALQEDQLRSLQERFAAAEDPRWAARALAGERAFGLSFFIDQQIQRSITRPQQGIGAMPSGLAGDLALSAYKASGLLSKDRTFYLEAMATNVALAELPAHERIKTGPPPNMTVTNKLLIFSRLILPALQRVHDRANEHAARMRVVETALGVERFRLAHSGALPENLEQLAPQCLRAVPLDPYDSQPLRYKRLPRGYVVYSIGSDRRDDGGTEPPSRAKVSNRSKTTPTDLTFAVEREPPLNPDR